MSSKRRCLEWLDRLDTAVDLPTAWESSSQHDSAFESATDKKLRPSATKKRKRLNTQYNMDAAEQSPDELSVVEDIGCTPRAGNLYQQTSAKSSTRSQSSRNLSPSKRKRGTNIDEDAASGRSASSKRSYVSGASEASSTHSSPLKGRNWLMALSRPVETEILSDNVIRQLPSGISGLINRLRRCSRLVRVVPGSLKTALRSHDEDPCWTGQDPWIVHANGSISWHPTWHREPSIWELDSIVRAAQSSDQRNDLESGWNSLSHGPILLLACSLSQHRNTLEPVNITLARLLPHLHNDANTAGMNKMVDFGIVLKPSSTLKEAWRYIEPEDDGRSRYWNQTHAEQIANRPLAISIETKREGSGLLEADLQLRVWVAAHFLRLAELRQILPTEQSVCLPLLLVLGTKWHYCIAKAEFDGDGHLLETIMYSQQFIGAVNTFAGLLSVLAVLLELLDWAENTYRPWFEKWVTKPV